MQNKFAKVLKSLIIGVATMTTLGCSSYAANLDATVPASLPISVTSAGKIVTATNAKIRNYGDLNILVSSINVSAQNGWTLVSKDDIEKAPLGSKVFAIGFNDSWADTTGAVDVYGFDRINSSSSISLTYDAKIPLVKVSGTQETVGTSVFVVKITNTTPAVMAAGNTWYKGSIDYSTITKITFVDEYTPTNSIDESWNADVDDTGAIKCYLTGTELTIAGNGSGKIMANPDSSHMFDCYDADDSKLTSINNLSLLDTSNATNMSSMFSNCDGLTSLNLSKFNTTKVTNMSGMFSGCRKLTSLDLSKFSTSSVTDMSYMFDQCKGLKNLDISKFNTAKVTNIANMFSSCSGLISLDVSSFNTSKVTNMSGVFNSCSSLKSVDISNFDTSNVTDMHSIFSSCTSLTSIDLSNFDTANVTNMESMFNECTVLWNLNVSSFDTSKVVNMSKMFCSCSSLATLNISNFDTSNVTDMESMFNGCSSLKTVYALNTWSTAKVISSQGMFLGCTKLKGDVAFDTRYTDKTYAKNAGGYLTDNQTPTMENGLSWYKSTEDRSTITQIAFMDSYEPTSTVDETWTADVKDTGAITCYRIGTEIIIAGNGVGGIKANTNSSYMFSGFSSLISIENLSLLNTGNVTNMNAMFRNCQKLTSLDVSKFNTTNVTDMGGMFWQCLDLTSLDVSGFETFKVVNMSNMFFSCTDLTFLDVSKFNTANVTDMSRMFWQCFKLTSLDVSGFETSKVTDMNNMFWRCEKLSSLDVSNFDTSKVTDMSGMFWVCISLTSLDLSKFSTSRVTNMTRMFSSCDKLTTIYASNTWNTANVINSDNMFENCTKLKGDIAFNSNYVDKTYATTSGGYLTYKAYSTQTLSLNVTPSGQVTGYSVNNIAEFSNWRMTQDWRKTIDAMAA